MRVHIHIGIFYLRMFLNSRAKKLHSVCPTNYQCIKRIQLKLCLMFLLLPGYGIMTCQLALLPQVHCYL